MATNELKNSIKKTQHMEGVNQMKTNLQAAPKMTSMRKVALAAGVLYLLTFISIPTLWLYAPVHDPNYVVGPGPDTGVIFGGVLEIFMALAVENGLGQNGTSRIAAAFRIRDHNAFFNCWSAGHDRSDSVEKFGGAY